MGRGKILIEVFWGIIGMSTVANAVWNWVLINQILTAGVSVCVITFYIVKLINFLISNKRTKNRMKNEDLLIEKELASMIELEKQDKEKELKKD